MSDLEDLAHKIKGLEDRIGARNATQLDSSTIDVGDGDSLVVSDVMADAAEASTVAIPGLQEALDLNQARLQENAEAVAAALDAVDVAVELAAAAETAGLAAGEEASLAADDALEKAQQALDAAAAAGGGATYSGTAPTSATPGTPGQQWFVWDSNYHVTGYYVYDGATSAWVQTVLDDGTFGNLSAARLTSGFIDAARIAANSLTAAVLAADTITSREIAADAILARNIKAAEITGAKIAAATILGGNIAATTITGGNIAANTITAGNIAANTITANEIAAGTITATQINLDTLNGKTITGALIKTAASGQRLELLQTRMDLYNSAGALSGRIYGGLNNGIVTGASLVLQAINGSASGQFLVAAPLTVNCSISPAPYLRAGFTYTGTTLSASISAVAEGLVVKGPLLADEVWDAVTNQRIIGPVRQATSIGGTRAVIAGTFDRLQYSYLNGSVRTEVPVMTGDPDGDTANVYLTATDFRTTDGSSIAADSGWLTITTTAGNADSANPPQYRKVGRQVYLRGLIAPTSTLQTIGSIPAGFRPAAQIEAACVRTPGSSASATFWDVRVAAGGAIALMGPSGGSGNINLAGFAPYLAEN